MVSQKKYEVILINVRHINEDTPFSVALLEISIWSLELLPLLPAPWSIWGFSIPHWLYIPNSRML